MRARVLALLSLLVLTTATAAARPRPKLSPPAIALLSTGRGVYLLAESNLAIPLEPGGRAAPLFAPAPAKLELVAVSPELGALLTVDDDLFRLKGATLERVGSRPGADPTATPDFTLVAGIEDKRALKLTRDGNAQLVPYHRDGRWELERPYLTPDGAQALVALRDYTQGLESYFFLVVDLKTLAVEEINLSKNFVPGRLRHTVSPTEVALQPFTQREDEAGVLELSPSDLVVFSFKTRTLGPAPPSLRPGLVSASKKYSLLAGAVSYSDDKRCGGDQTLLFEEGKAKPARFVIGAGSVVSVLDFLPDDSGMIANVLNLKTCKNRGVVIPFADESPAKWKSFALPADGKIAGRVIR